MLEKSQLEALQNAAEEMGFSAIALAQGINQLGRAAYEYVALPMKHEQLIYEIERVRFWKALTLGLTYSEKTYQVPPFAEWKQRKIDHR